MVITLFQRRATREAAAEAYRRVVAQARQPVFFADCGVPDTLDGRFELVCLHGFLYLYRLKSARPQANRLAQAFFDTMFADFDRSLRESGVGDLSVGKHVKRMARGFYGRIRAYEAGLERDDSTLDAALARNLYGTLERPPPGLAAMSAYLHAAAAALDRQPTDDLLAGRVAFAVLPAVAAASAAGAPNARATP